MRSYGPTGQRVFEASKCCRRSSRIDFIRRFASPEAGTHDFPHPNEFDEATAASRDLETWMRVGLFDREPGDASNASCLANFPRRLT